MLHWNLSLLKCLILAIKEFWKLQNWNIEIILEIGVMPITISNNNNINNNNYSLNWYFYEVMLDKMIWKSGPDINYQTFGKFFSLFHSKILFMKVLWSIQSSEI